MPLLPVSNTKFNVSGKSPSLACKMTIPPVSWVKEILVNNREGGSMNSSWAARVEGTSQEKNSAREEMNLFILFGGGSPGTGAANYMTNIRYKLMQGFFPFK